MLYNISGGNSPYISSIDWWTTWVRYEMSTSVTDFTAEQRAAAVRTIFSELLKAAGRSIRFPEPMDDQVRNAQLGNKHNLTTLLGPIPTFEPNTELELEEWVDTVANKIRMRGIHQTLFREIWMHAAAPDFAAAVEKASDETYEGMVDQVALELFPRSEAYHEVELWFFMPERGTSVRHSFGRVAHAAARYVRLCKRHCRTYAFGSDQIRDCYLRALPEPIEDKLVESNLHTTVDSILVHAQQFEVKRTKAKYPFVTTHAQMQDQPVPGSDSPPPVGVSRSDKRRKTLTDDERERSAKIARERQFQCKGCLGFHYRKNCPYHNTRCRRCNAIGHIEKACNYWVVKDAKGRVDAKVTDKPSGYDIKLRTDRTQQDRLETADATVAGVLQQLLKNSEEAKRYRQSKVQAKIAAGKRPPLRQKPYRKEDPGRLGRVEPATTTQMPVVPEELSSGEEDPNHLVIEPLVTDLVQSVKQWAAPVGNRPQGFYLPVEIDYIQYSAVLDTGAWRSVISGRVAANHGIKPTGQRYKLQGLGTAYADISYPVECVVSGTSMEIEFLILPGFSFDVLIGLKDLLARYTVDRKGTLEVTLEPHRSVPLALLRDVTSGVDESRTDQELMATHEETLKKNFGHYDPDFFKVVWDLFKDYTACWLRPRSGQFKGAYAVIEPIARPCKLSRRPLSPAKKEEVERQLRSQLEAGVIRPSKSEWASPLHLVTKADGTWRIVIDYREMNKRIKADTYPLPLIQEILHEIAGHKWYIVMDLNWGFWNLPITEESKSCTAFCTHMGLYEFNVLPFGMKNSPAEFQRMSDYVWGHLYGNNVKVYIDDIIIYGNCVNDLLELLREVLESAVKCGVYFKLSKCRLFHKEIKILGSILSEDGIACDPERIEALEKAERPKNRSELVSFLATCSYMRQHIPRYATVTAPLYDIAPKKALFVWTRTQEESYRQILELLQQAVVLGAPRGLGPFFLFADASDVGIGGCLLQLQDGGRLYPISFFSKRLTQTERNWDTREREAFAIKYGLQRFRELIEGHKIYVFTDQASLQWAQLAPQSKIRRWVWFMQQFDVEIYHIRGTVNVIADWLSRTTPEEIGDQDAILDTVGLPIPICIQRPTEQLPEIILPGPPQLREEYENIPDADKVHIVKGTDGSFYGFRTGKLYIPPKYREAFMYWLHAREGGAHRGIRATIKTLQQAVYWPGLPKDVAFYVNRCLICTRLRNPLRANPKRCLERPGAFDLISLDYVGPRFYQGDSWHYLVVIDHATRYVLTSATLFATSEHVCSTLRNEWVKVFGVPKAILTDNGPQFTSNKYKHYVLEELKSTIIYTSPYHPEGNAINEAVHQSLERGMNARVIQPGLKTFAEHLQGITQAYNTAWQSVLKMSPYKALFGKDMVLPGFQILYPYQPEVDRKYMIKLREYIRQIEPHLPKFPEGPAVKEQEEIVEGDFCVFERPEYDQKHYNPEGSSVHAYGLKWSLPSRIMEVAAERVKVKEYATNLERYVPRSKLIMLPKEVPPTLTKVNWEHIQHSMPRIQKEPLDINLLPEAYRRLPVKPTIKSEKWTQVADRAQQQYIPDQQESELLGRTGSRKRRRTRQVVKGELPDIGMEGTAFTILTGTSELKNVPPLRDKSSKIKEEYESSDEEKVP